MKTIYFVRHGESESNVGAPVFLGESSLLTERGEEQARFIAKRCARLKVDVLISSTAVRAKATAQKIGEEIGKEVEILEMLTERKLPSELLGKSREDKNNEAMYARWLMSFYEEGSRVGDGDNFLIFKSRVSEALKYFVDRTESSILVVTHGFFLHMAVALVLLGETFTVDEFKRVAVAVWMDNTGLTRFDYRVAEDKKRIDRVPYQGWILRVWNDHAHLG
ncbi:MAG: histidine phosphatase family protein [Patescibacteria group bacterium]